MLECSKLEGITSLKMKGLFKNVVAQFIGRPCLINQATTKLRMTKGSSFDITQGDG
jgi:hypothetical protein